MSPEPLADEIRALAEGSVAGYRMPRVTFHLGRWLRSTDWYPDYQLRLYDRRRARWSGRLVHESVKADGPVVDLHGEILHYAYRDLSHHLQTMDRYTTLAARQMFEDGRTRRLVGPGGASRRRRFCATTCCAAASATACPASSSRR